VRELHVGKELRLLLPEAALVHWGINGWQNPADVTTEDWGLGHVAHLPTEKLAVDELIDFTFDWTGRNAWQGEDYQVVVIAEAIPGLQSI
jgi:glucoamylase